MSNSFSTPDEAPKEICQNVDSDFQHVIDNVRRPLHGEGYNELLKSRIDGSVDLSQISGPNGRSRSTPLSQIGFRDPASVGAGQQLTMLSIEVHLTVYARIHHILHFCPYFINLWPFEVEF